MNIIIRIDCDNPNFDPPEPELARILRRLAGQVADSIYDKSLHDINGNDVGSMVVMKGSRKYRSDTIT